MFLGYYTKESFIRTRLLFNIDKEMYLIQVYCKLSVANLHNTLVINRLTEKLLRERRSLNKSGGRGGWPLRLKRILHFSSHKIR